LIQKLEGKALLLIKKLDKIKCLRIEWKI